MRKIFHTCSLVCLVFLAILNTTAMAAEHPGGNGDRTGWTSDSSLKCESCHAGQTKHTAGPHGGYQATTDKCMACHTVHKAKNSSLLPGTTVTATCNFCHDLTGTQVAPYYIGYLTTGSTVKAAHKVDGLDIPLDPLRDTWNNMPGGDPFTGGDSTLNTSAQGKLSGTKFTCDSCHTPHAIEGSTVDPYFGESRLKFEVIDGDKGRFWLTDRLLKAKLNGSNTAVYSYSSDWCAACHKGRYKNQVIQVHNHPVAMLENGAGNRAMGYQFIESLSSDDIVGFSSAAALKSYLVQSAKDGRRIGEYPTFYWSTGSSDTVDLGLKGTGTRVIKKDPRSNKIYTMSEGDPLDVDPVTRIPKPFPDGNLDYDTYKGVGPSCQQCHANARDIEKSFSDGLNDGTLITTFPHVSKYRSFTVEGGDDFCTNCHGINDLP